jgi:hypothetical protein
MRTARLSRYPKSIWKGAGKKLGKNQHTKRVKVQFNKTAKVRSFRVSEPSKLYTTTNVKTRLWGRTKKKGENIPSINNNTRKQFFKNVEELEKYRQRMNKLRLIRREDKIKIKRLKTLRSLPRRDRRRKRIIKLYYKDIREKENLEQKISKFLDESSQ